MNKVKLTIIYVTFPSKNVFWSLSILKITAKSFQKPSNTFFEYLKTSNFLSKNLKNRSGKTKYVFSVFVKKWDCFWICFNRDCLKNEKVKSTYLTSFNQYGTCSTLYFIKANQTAFSCTIYIPKIKIQSLVFLALPLLIYRYP